METYLLRNYWYPGKEIEYSITSSQKYGPTVTDLC